VLLAEVAAVVLDRGHRVLVVPVVGQQQLQVQHQQQQPQTRVAVVVVIAAQVPAVTADPA
jgi:hypothetical protein